MFKTVIATATATLLVVGAVGAAGVQYVSSKLPENFNSISEIKSGYEQFKSVAEAGNKISPEVLDLAKDQEFVDIAERYSNDEKFRADVEALQAQQN